MTAPRHFVDLADLTTADLRGMLDQAKAMKNMRTGFPKAMRDAHKALEGHVALMLFEKPSTRTRLSFDVALRQLGGESIVAEASTTQLGRGETIADTARVMSRFVDAIIVRANNHGAVIELAANASVPVINGLTDWSHPCQLMADIMTYEEKKGPVKGAIFAWVGDGNNVAVSLIHAAVRFGFSLRLACPDAYAVPQKALEWARTEGGDVTVTTDPAIAVAGADCVVTDTFISMGNTDADERLAALMPYQVTDALMAKAKPDAIFMHCLPAHRGEEVETSVIDGPQSVVFDEAENRLHAQKAILRWCLHKD